MSPMFTLEVDAGAEYGVMTEGSSHIVVRCERNDHGLVVTPVGRASSLAHAWEQVDALNAGTITL